MRKIGTFALVAVVGLTLSGCGTSEDYRKGILGKWKVSQSMGMMTLNGTAEFRKDGTVTTEMSGMRIESTYKFLDDETIELVMSVRGQKLTEKNTIVSMSADEMSMRDPKGVRADFTRIK